VPRRWSVVVVVMVVTLAASCSPVAVDRAGAPPASSAPGTVPATTTTTTPVPVDLADIVAGATMTDRGRRLFLAANPKVEELAAFGRSCGVDADPAGGTEPKVHTQGCYANGQIHLLATDRAGAHDLLYVVAAHELLHAAYAQLPGADRARIDTELQAARTNGNARLEERLKPYGDGPTLINEIHSILGSELDGLSPVLEAHYAQFFTDRAAVVAIRKRTLGAREDEIQRLRVDTDVLDARIASLKDNQEALRAANDIRTYNANVPVINGLIARYNDEVAQLNQRVEEYNGLLSG